MFHVSLFVVCSNGVEEPMEEPAPEPEPEPEPEPKVEEMKPEVEEKVLEEMEEKAPSPVPVESPPNTLEPPKVRRNYFLVVSISYYKGQYKFIESKVMHLTF